MGLMHKLRRLPKQIPALTALTGEPRYSHVVNQLVIHCSAGVTVD
jgi:hypothetical protein